LLAENGDPADSDLREFEFKKNQYGPLGEKIVLHYTRGLFLPLRGVSSLEKAAIEARAEQIFLDLLRRFVRNGRNVSDRPRANNYAPTVFADEREAKAEKIWKKDLDGAMARLF
jgi:RecA-family ATPase